MITAIYAGLLGLILLGLSIKVIGERRRTGIAIGDGDNALLRRRMRVQANFCEYAPIAVVLIALAELSGAWPILIHLLGLTLLIGRCIHAFGVGQEVENLRYRVVGMSMTFGVVGVASVLGIVTGF